MQCHLRFEGGVDEADTSVSTAFATENAPCMSAVHGMAGGGLGPPFNWSVSGFRMRAAAGINRR